MDIRNKIELFSDGACKGNPGLGGWGVLIKNSKNLNELKGTQQQTTNNRMELINGLINGKIMDGKLPPKSQ